MNDRDGFRIYREVMKLGTEKINERDMNEGEDP
jgi:hypothetical protein